MSGEQTDQTAPTLATARKAISVCAVFGRYAATRSPGCTPISFVNAAASEATWRRSSGQLVSLSSPCASRVSLLAIRAGRPAASPASAWRSAWAARFKVAPRNHTAPGMRSSHRARSKGVGDCSSKNSHKLSQKASSSVIDHCHSAS
ncbi:hypothetical protein BH11PSE10_BH11PSE10_15330 [soil metagenome]